MIKNEVKHLLDKDPLLTKLQFTLILGIILLFPSWADYGMVGVEFVFYSILYLPAAILLLHFSNKVLYENNRPNSHYNTARVGTIVGALLLIPYWLFRYLGWLTH